MDLETARAHFRRNHQAVMVTARLDGRPQTSPVTASVDGEGRIVVSTRETAMKVKNLERHPQGSICGLGESFFGPWVQVDGPVTIVRLPAAMEPLVEYYRSIRGEHPDWDDYRAAMERDRRVLLRLTIAAAGPDTAG